MIPSADTILSRFVIRAKFRHMQVLVKLAELGSMRRAAEAINMTQPAISQQVSELEKLIGAPLFFRHAKGVEPTEVANELLPVAHRVLSALQDGSEAVAHRMRANAGTVSIAASPAAIGGLLLSTLGAFSEAHPHIQVQIIEGTGLGPDEDMFGSADIICTREPRIVPEGWSFVRCLEDRLIVVCGAHHPLAAKADVNELDLGHYKWLMNRSGSVARHKFEEALESYGWSEASRGSLILHVPELTRALLTTHEYLAILPQSVAQPWLSSGLVKSLDTNLTEPLPPLGVMRPSTSQGNAIETFVGFLQERFFVDATNPS